VKRLHKTIFPIGIKFISIGLSQEQAELGWVCDKGGSRGGRFGRSPP